MNTNADLKLYFNSISKTYNVNIIASFFITHFLRKRLVNKIKSFEDKSILDIMSGRGENIKHIKKYNGQTKITTIDFSKCMNNIARKRLKKRSIIQIENNFFNTNCQPKSFDIILCSFGVKTLTIGKTNILSKKISHLLKSNGEVLVLEMVKPKNLYFLKLIKWYLERILPILFGNQFKLLFPYIKTHKNMDYLKDSFISNKLDIIEHKRVFDLFEIIHAKAK